MGEKKRTSTYNPQEVKDGVVLRVSKSSYNQYDKCPRQYWWNKIALPDMDIPSSEAAIRGTAIHQVMEDSLRELSLDKSCDIAADVMMDTTFNRHAIAQGVQSEAGVDALREILEAIAAQWGFLEIVELEDKHVHPYTISVLTDDGEIHYPVELVGMIDGVFRHPDGHLVVVELKTGNANEGKLSRTRGELCFYRKLLMLKGYDEPTHFLTIFPDADDPDFLMGLMGKRNKEVFMGESQGLAVYEPVKTVSINAMEKKLKDSVHGIMTQEWPIHWREFFCTQWCEFHLSCNEELLGMGEVV